MRELLGGPARYDTAQVCLNGHVTNPRFQKGSIFNVDYCEECGSKTITKCPACNTNIRGHFHCPGVLVLGMGERTAPKFCHNCGKPYPWTESRLQAVRDYLDELEEFNSEEKAILKDSLDDLVRQTPRTELAIHRLKKFLKKAGVPVYEGLKHVAKEILTEAVKKAIFPA